MPILLANKNETYLFLKIMNILSNIKFCFKEAEFSYDISRLYYLYFYKKMNGKLFEYLL